MDNFLDLDFQDIFMSLAMDEFEEVRIILARGIHETLTLMEK